MYSVFKLPKFEHFDASTVDEAVSLLGKHAKARVLAGGSVLLWDMKIRLASYEAIVNLKTIPNMNYIKEEGGMLKIGALATLREIGKSPIVGSVYSAIAQAAGAAGTPQIRNAGTIAGNICQGVQCWFFRAPEISCLRKNPAGVCYGIAGDNRYHSIFGAVSGCVAVNPSDLAPALVALDAKIKTSKRTINAEEFFAYNGLETTALAADEIVTEVQVPTPAAGTKSAFIKLALRKSIDFPLVNCAAAIGGGAARICLNAVYNKPYRATKAEDAIKGKTIDEANAEAAGTAAVDGAVPLTTGVGNKYKVQIAKAMVKRAILACK